jgi:acetolactate synthase I/II/III large subunit
VNGAESLVRTLVAGGIDVCFANPGTSEMHFVAALDRVAGMRCILGLFEGVVTGAADGYGRMADKPAATLLHLGGGFSNGMSHLHNAGKSNTPIVNIVGDQATYHRRHDPDLGSSMDIEGVSRAVSHWVRTSRSPSALAQDGADAITAALTPPGSIATLIMPADVSWGESDSVKPAFAESAPRRSSAAREAIRATANIIRSREPAVLMLSGLGTRSKALSIAAAIAAATGIRVMVPPLNARIERGAGRASVERLPYPIDQALAALKGVRHVILAGARAPVANFAYPGKPSMLTEAACRIHVLAKPEENIAEALEWLADELGVAVTHPNATPDPTRSAPRDPPTGALTSQSIGAALAACLPDNAVVIDESLTSGRTFYAAMADAAPHDWLQNIGGATGMAMPIGVGAAIACPDRRVVCLEGDGCGMYMPQALWTQARERLKVTTVVFANRSYAILRQELTNVGAANPGPTALDMLDIGNPDIRWTGLANSLGVPAERATSSEELTAQLHRALREAGPYLIEVAL